MTPTIGRIVHYVSFGTPGGEYPMACRAAMVTAVGAWVDDEVRELDLDDDDDAPRQRLLLQRYDPLAVALTVYNPTGMFMNQVIPHDQGAELGAAFGEQHPPARSLLCTGRDHRGGTWHWPVLQ